MVLKIIGLVITALIIIMLSAWGALALYYSLPAGLNIALAITYALVAIFAVISLAMQRWRRRVLVVYAVLFTVLLVWWNSIEPSNDRDWQTDVAVLPYATIDGDLVTVHNIRNFNYHTETDYIPAYYDKTFDLRKLVSVDLVAVYWMGPAIAHTFLSFGFEGDNYIAVSIETRKEKGEGYSTLKGFFKQYELYYVVADERDVIRLRTNYRKNPPEEVYLYRVHRPIENGQRLFLKYIREINALKETPAFYNTLVHNCTTTIWLNAKVNPTRPPLSWKLLLSGYVPEYLYDLDTLDTSIPFPELQNRVHINKRAHQADKSPNFSRLIRTVE